MTILYDLALMQKDLDSSITSNHNLHTEDLYGRKKIALLVELGELANEIRFFKFWSHDQEPRSQDLVKEEYIDCVHFTLSLCIGHHKYNDSHKLKEFLSDARPLHYGNLEEQFLNLYSEISNYMHSNPEEILNLILGLGELLGYDEKSIDEGYRAKNKVNIKRQKDMY